MKRLAPLAFTLLYLVAMVRPITPLIEFAVNQEQIAQFLCTNRDRPDLRCNGKCYLMQMLQEQKDEKEESPIMMDLSEYPIGFVKIVEIALKTVSATIPEQSFGIVNHYSYLYFFSEFHPPTSPV